MPEFHVIFARKIFFSIFLEGGECPPCQPVYYAYDQFVLSLFGSQGRLSPNNYGAIPPFSLLNAPLICHIHKQFLDIVYAILCNFMRVFSEFWKLSVRDNDPEKQKNTNGVGKAHCMVSFLSGG